MASSWQELWKFADLLRTFPGDREVVLRAAVSREYYACYHRARDFALTDGPDPWTDPSPEYEGSAHVSLWNHFRRHRETEGAETVQSDGKAAHKDRKMADYDVGGPFTRAEAQRARERAELVMEQLGALDGKRLPDD